MLNFHRQYYVGKRRQRGIQRLGERDDEHALGAADLGDRQQLSRLSAPRHEHHYISLLEKARRAVHGFGGRYEPCGPLNAAHQMGKMPAGDPGMPASARSDARGVLKCAYRLRERLHVHHFACTEHFPRFGLKCRFRPCHCLFCHLPISPTGYLRSFS